MLNFTTLHTPPLLAGHPRLPAAPAHMPVPVVEDSSDMALLVVQRRRSVPAKGRIEEENGCIDLRDGTRIGLLVPPR